MIAKSTVRSWRRAATVLTLAAALGGRGTLCPAQVRAVSNLPEAQAGQAYDPISIVDGGVPPFTTQIVAGDMPVGMTVDRTGTLVGAPTAAGTFVFSLRVADAATPPAVVEQTFRLHVNPSANTPH